MNTPVVRLDEALGDRETELTLIAWPFVRGYGRRADVPSALQRNYARGLIVYLMVIWLIAVAVFAVGRIRRRRTAQKVPS